MAANGKKLMSLFSASAENFVDVRLPDILGIEDTPELLAFRCSSTGIPLWPQVRVSFHRYIMGDLVYSTANMQPPLRTNKVRAMRSLAGAFAHNARMRTEGMQSDVMLTTEAIGDQLIDGKLFNRYVDPFGIRGSHKDMVLSDLFEWNWPFPRHNERIYIHSTIQAASALRWRLGVSARARKDARDLTALVSERAQMLLGWEIGPQRRAEMERRLAIKIMGIPLRYAAYRALLKRVRPKVVVSSSACYGLISPLIVAAHDLDIVTAEYQHGAICEGHDAYNFASSVLADEAYRRTLPRYYLSYGRWWHDQVNAPVEMVPIGYPNRSRRLEGRQAVRGEPRNVLILSDGIEFDLYLSLAQKIAGSLAGTGTRVVLRPHPLERTDVLRRFGTQIGDIVIDETADLYHALVAASCVLSEGSTGLFEAVGLVDRVVMLYTAKARFHFTRHPFISVESDEDAVRAAQGKLDQAGKLEVGDLWAEGWQSNYQNFLREKAGLQ